MATTVHSQRRERTPKTGSQSLLPGLILTVLAVVGARFVSRALPDVPLIVAAVLAGVVIGNAGLGTHDAATGLAFASKTLLRTGIVLLGLRLSVGDMTALGPAALLLIVATVSITFFGVQFIGQRMGLSRGLSLLVASGFSICGNSAIASVASVAETEDEDIAAAIGLVTLCGTLAIFVIPTLGSGLGLSELQLGVWAGAGVQDTAQVIAVASAAGPAVLAIATAVKLTRVLFLAPIVAGVAFWNRRRSPISAPESRPGPAMLPLFVVGFLVTMVLRTSGLLPVEALDAGRALEQHALAAGVVGLGSSVRFASLRRVGLKPLLLGAIAWLIVGGVSLAGAMLLPIG